MADPIRFYKGEETGIVHENYHDISTSLFKDQYLKALNEIGAYLSYYKTIDEVNNESDDEEDEEQITKQNKSKKQPQHIELNNIFAFIGERGTGKTSCMKSVADMLYQYRKSTNKNGCEKFLKIDPIDPTTFNDNTNLMQVVIGVMFEKFKDKVANSDNLPNNADRDTYEKNKQNLLKAFQDVKECIKYISNPKLLNCEDDDISQLAGMASVSKLNDRIGKLADRYLEFFDKNILVLQIDDIDLQTKYAYQMVEEIRKYFMHKNIIVLMAVKMEQLAKVIENETAKQYEPLKKLEGITLPEISDMAIRYLLKLIPINHRIYMPTAEVYVDRGLRYFTSREDELKYEGKTGDENKALLGDWTSVKYAVTSLIYNKCRFLFYHSKGVVSPIVPRNLRELRYLFAMLLEMNDYCRFKKTDENEQNKDLFLKYLNNNWVNSNISSDDYYIISDIVGIKDATSINKTIIQLLVTRFDSLFKQIKDGTDNEQEASNVIKQIIDVRNTPYNLSIADAYVIIDHIKNRVVSTSEKMLIFYIETFYSVMLYRYYNEYGESIRKGKKEKSVLSKEDVDSTIISQEVVDNFSNYEVLVGGSFINTEVYKLVAREQKTGLARERRKINFNKLIDIAKEIIKTDENGAVLPCTDSKKLQFVEFFALCISRPLEAGDSNKNKEYRKRNVLYYNDFADTHDSVEFDMGAFFFNVFDFERAYNRVNKNLFQCAIKTPGSIYSKVLDEITHEYRKDYKDLPEYQNVKDIVEDTEEYKLLSCVAIRNFEVLASFLSKFRYWQERRSPEDSNSKNLGKLFEHIKGCKVSTYDINETTKEHCAIDFGFYECIQKLLENDWDLFDEIFAEPLLVKALRFFPTDRKTSYNQLRIKVNDSKVFTSNIEVNKKWNGLNYFKKENYKKKLDINKARSIVKQFITDNNLE